MHTITVLRISMSVASGSRLRECKWDQVERVDVVSRNDH